MKIKCLIIDDEPLAINVIKNYLEQIEDLELVNTFSNSIEGLNFLKNNTIDVIFLDINMPIWDGWDFLDEIVKLELQHTFEIYMVSSSTSPHDKEKAESYRFVKGFLTKPLEISDLNTIL